MSVFGDSGVGKTTLIQRYITDKFELDIGRSMGVNVHTKIVYIEGFVVNLQIWDFMGEERFKTILPTYARGTFGGIFMYDITNKSSLLNLKEWILFFHNKVISHLTQIPILIVGSKLDLYANREVNLEDAYNLSEFYNILGYIECSAKTGENVDKLFLTLTTEIMKKSNLI
ncbi:MAG: Rab family GTPase [Candidatus Thorarchaeota archaeon]